MGIHTKLLKITFLVSLGLLTNTQLFAMGMFPESSENPPPVMNNPPPSAPAPLALLLVGMGASGVTGFYLGKRKKK